MHPLLFSFVLHVTRTTKDERLVIVNYSPPRLPLSPKKRNLIFGKIKSPTNNVVLEMSRVFGYSVDGYAAAVRTAAAASRQPASFA